VPAATQNKRTFGEYRYPHWLKGGDVSNCAWASATSATEPEAAFLRFSRQSFTAKIRIYAKVFYFLTYTPERIILSVRAMKKGKERRNGR
jgi:hypothetical protein